MEQLSAAEFWQRATHGPTMVPEMNLFEMVCLTLITEFDVLI